MKTRTHDNATSIGMERTVRSGGMTTTPPRLKTLEIRSPLESPGDATVESLSVELDPEYRARRWRGKTLREYFQTRYEVTNSGCWEWRGATTPLGLG